MWLGGGNWRTICSRHWLRVTEESCHFTVPYTYEECGPGSVVGIETGYGLGGTGIESRWVAKFYAPLHTGPGAHPASCTMGTGSFSGVKSGRGVTLTPQPLLVPWSWKSRAIPLLPYRPYGLYRSSVPVQGCALPFLYIWGLVSVRTPCAKIILSFPSAQARILGCRR